MKMTKNFDRSARRCVRMGLVLAGMSVPLLASAQFTFVSQQARVEAHAYQSESTTESSPSGATGSLYLFAKVGDDSIVTSNAVARTTVEAGRVGINAGVGGSTFDTDFSWSCGSYYECQYLSPPIAGSSASVALYFDVTQAIEAAVLVESAYKTGYGYVAGDVSFPLQFEKQLGDGHWVSVAAPTQAEVLQNSGFRNHVSGMLNLEAGHYRMLASYASTTVYKGDYDWGGASITVTAVPEVSTWALMGLGLVGLGCVSRRRRPVQLAA